MRRFLALLAAGVCSAGVAEGFSHAITNWTPCHGEAEACGMNGITGMVLALAMILLSMVVFGLVLIFRPTIRAVFLGLMGLLVPVELWLLLIIQHGIRVNDSLMVNWHTVQEILQLVGTPALAVTIQWAVLRMLAVRREPLAQGG